MTRESYDIAAQEPTQTADHAAARPFLDYLKTILATLLVALLLKTFVLEAFRIPSGSMENTLQVGDFLLVNKLAYGLRTPRYLPMTSLAIPSISLPIFSGVERGEVIVFEFPGHYDLTEGGEQLNYIKRCIGLPGDTVLIRQSRVFVNGRELSLPPAAKLGDNGGVFSWHRGVRLVPDGRGYTENDYGPVVVPKRGDIVPLSRETIDDWKSLILRKGHRIHEEPDGRIMVDAELAQEYVVEDDYYFVLGDNRHNSLDSRFWGFVPDRFVIGEALMVYWSWDADLAMTNPWKKAKSTRWGRIGMLIR